MAIDTRRLRRAALATLMTGLAGTGALLMTATAATAASPAPGDPPSVQSSSTITGMWAWGNSVDPSVDNRGLGQAALAPAALASFAQQHGLSSVYLSVPWSANQGAIGTWLADSVDALHAVGVRVSALGGDASWLANPSLVAQWVSDARAAADFDAVQLDVEPWAAQAHPDFATITPAYVALLRAAKSAAGPLPLGADLPWWLTTVSPGDGTVFDALLPLLDSVAIVAFADHAAGPDGVIALAQPAADAASATGRPFTIGVETDSPDVAGGAQFTFADDGEAALVTETDAVRDAFSATSGYGGVTVEHLRSWIALIG
ncbi:hypothetical protein ACPPVQ_11160 [Diaminobutyricibacter sp. McL0618]|uniref:hypothetical protein n=1 Tax=Leifsonia sp. McL0618 TaxID=3415677 RepID=UPI003CF750C0